MRTVTEAAAIKRINRKLRRENQQLHKSPADRWRYDLGQFYIRDFTYPTNTVIATHCKVERLGRELCVLRDDEFLA